MIRGRGEGEGRKEEERALSFVYIRFNGELTGKEFLLCKDIVPEQLIGQLHK